MTSGQAGLVLERSSPKCKHEDLSSTSGTQVKIWVWYHMLIIPVFGRQRETRASWTHWPDTQADECALGSGRGSVSKSKMETPDVDL